MKKAGSTDGKAVRDALLSIDKYDGLIKTYTKPFTADNHDALGPKDYIFAHFVKGEILPLAQ
jgi:branched-chain amino acid transport system substrate-binding protein